MDDNDKARLVGSLRLGIGAALLVAPGRAGKIWVGPGADDRGAQVFARALGARDAVLGLKTLSELGQKKEMKHWLQLGAAADAADAAATVVAWRALSPGRRIVMPLVAAAVGFVGWTVASTID